MLGTVIDLDYLIHLFHEHPCARIAYGSKSVYGILFHIESTLLQVCSAILKEFINWHLSYERDTSNEFPDCISCRADTFQNIGFYC